MPSSSFADLLANEDDPMGRTPLVAGRFGGDHVLVPLLTRELPVLTDQLKVAAALARTSDASVTVVDPVVGPERASDAYYRAAKDSDEVALLEWVFDHTAESLPGVDGDFVHAHNVVRGLVRAVRDRDIDTLVVPGRSAASRFRAGVTEQVAAHVDADVVVVNGLAGLQTAASILLPVAGGPHSGLAADVAAAIAADRDAWIDVLHVVDEGATDRRCERADDLVAEVVDRIDRSETTSTWMLEATDTTEAIIEQSRYYDLTVIGAPTKGRLRRFIFGSTNDSVRAGAESVVLSVRNNASLTDAE